MTIDDASSQANNPYAPDEGRTSYTPGHIPLPKHPHLVVKTELLARPDPFTLYFGFFGSRSWQANAARGLSERVDNTQFLLNRLPTQDELDAFTVYSSRYIYHQRMGAPIAGSLFLARAYMQARSSAALAPFMPGPGLADGANANAKLTPTPKQVVDALRVYARVDAAGFRQALVFGGIKWVFWTLAGTVASSMWALFHDTRESMADPRLRQFMAELSQHPPKEMRKRKLEAAMEMQRQRHSERQQRDLGVARESASASEREPEPAQMETGHGHGHDQGYGEGSEGTGAGAGVGVGVGVGGGSGSGYGYGYSSQDANSSARQSAPSPQQYGDASRGSSSGSDFFDGDDASPVAADYRSEGLSGLQGSAWDRIRQQSGAVSQGRSNPILVSSSPSPSPQPQSQSQWGSWKNQDHNSAAADSERQQREQAQAEFDRMLEAERTLGNEAPDGSGQKKGWGRWN
ncbi:putative endo-1,3(4)-beta-glucanase [Aspergillus clavatus NRRL 1]|uniref:Endo-1,3(4)-beta-glucanase n=1 Tax=Aspergillus clavatus (strain ATCC 1007 / CBS 513.65 / DSM 816 / NCTC 3887 / NRRL 1 / QM 1276 / 107) TaxID=344612 RepID=A1CBY2_ASPCL|nr:uncharacterized protein ACLA_016960 [Aspergillus clavatus NRRL 1]EAW13250.1 conserved hypothetical protein [Aspergillus clavatus NRRL 1]